MSVSPGKVSLVTTVVAIILTALYVGACWLLISRFALDNPLPDLQWQRALVIFSGVSSVGFAAIGVLLGTTVQQVNVSAAKADAGKKAGVIKDAISTLTAPAGEQPDDRGGGKDERISRAHRTLLDGLA